MPRSFMVYTSVFPGAHAATMILGESRFGYVDLALYNRTQMREIFSSLFLFEAFKDKASLGGLPVLNWVLILTHFFL